MPKVSKVIEEYYGEKLYKSLIMRAEKSKFNGFKLTTSTKPELMAIIGDLLDVKRMAEDHTHSVGETLKNLEVDYNKLKASIELNSDVVEVADIVVVADSDVVDSGILGSVDGVEPQTPVKPKIERSIEVKQDIKLEDINTGPDGTHRYSDW